MVDGRDGGLAATHRATPDLKGKNGVCALTTARQAALHSKLKKLHVF